MKGWAAMQVMLLDPCSHQHAALLHLNAQSEAQAAGAAQQLFTPQ
jgi:hypothetical protein